MNLLMMVPFQYSSFAKQETHEGFQDLAGNNLTDRDSILPKAFFVFVAYFSR